MSTTTAVLGAAGLGIALVPLVLAGRDVADRALPGRPRPVRALGATVVVLAGALLTGEAVGSVGLFKRWPVLAGLMVVGFAGGFLVRRLLPAAIADARCGAAGQPLGGPGRALALAGAAVLTLQWTAFSVLAVLTGIRGDDSQIYHLPTALLFAQTGSTTGLAQVDPRAPVAFYPHAAELLQAIGIVATGRDVLSFFAGLSFAALALVAAWAIGARWGRGWRAVLLVSAVLAVPVVAVTQAGTALVDVPVLALVLTAVALLMWAFDGGAALVLAGLAAGAAVAVKLTAVPVLIVGLVGFVLVRGRQPGRPRRLPVAGLWLFGAIALPAYWLLRNLVHSGSPMPAMHLPFFRTQTFPLLHEGGFSVANYLGQPAVWRHVFLPQLAWSLGWGWPLIVGLPVLGIGLAARLKGPRRALAACAAAAFLTYLVTPFSAGGPTGHPGVLFYVNLRYLATALALGGVALASAPMGRRADRVLGAAGAAALALAWWPRWRVGGWPRLHGWDAMITATLAMALLGAAVPFATRRSRPVRATVAALAGLAVVGTSAWVAARPPGPGYDQPVQGLAGAYRWANTVHGQRIGVAGFSQTYPLAGVDLSNRVTYVGVLAAHGAFADARDCQGWRRTLADLRPAYLVLGGEGRREHPVHLDWVATDPAASKLTSFGAITVWRYRSDGSPAPC